MDNIIYRGWVKTFRKENSIMDVICKSCGKDHFVIKDGQLVCKGCGEVLHIADDEKCSEENVHVVDSQEFIAYDEYLG